MKNNIIWSLIFIMGALTLPFARAEATVGRSDSATERSARKQLSKKEQFRKVNVRVADGVAQINGTVDLLVHKLDAEKQVKRVDSVQAVSNQIEVVPQTPVTDAALVDKLAKKLRYDRVGYGIMFNNLAVDVRDGMVTVSGNVRDYADRNSALAIVETTPGVKGLFDEIEVAPPSGFDDELRLRMASAIYGHSALTRYALDPQKPIRIVVDRGRVALHGVVENQLDKQIALAQARSVPGAFAVEDRLFVATDLAR
jgi:osmotically-inducible protein OsmY